MNGGLVEELSAGYEEFNARSFDLLARRLTPKFEWHEAAEVAGPKVCRSREEFIRFMQGFDLLWAEFVFEPLELELAARDVILAKVRAVGRGRASDEPVNFVIHHVWRHTGEGFDRMDAYLDEAEARAAAAPR